VGYVFVDDTDLVVTAADACTVLGKLLRSVTRWEGLLKATGGAIAPEKSFWYGMTWILKHGKWRPTNIQEGHLLVADSNGQLQVLQQREINDAQRTLGVHIDPMGTSQAEFDYLRAAATSWAQKLGRSYTTKSLARQALDTTILRKLSY
jgi:hypothetical protein